MNDNLSREFVDVMKSIAVQMERQTASLREITAVLRQTDTHVRHSISELIDTVSEVSTSIDTLSETIYTPQVKTCDETPEIPARPGRKHIWNW